MPPTLTIPSAPTLADYATPALAILSIKRSPETTQIMAMDLAREIPGLPPARPVDPNYQEKQKLEAVRLELASALDRVNNVLKSPARNGNHSDAAAKTGKIPVRLN
jgi:hypothetical protein